MVTMFSKRLGVIVMCLIGSVPTAAQSVLNRITTLQGSEPSILSTAPLSNPSSYQSKARTDAVNNLPATATDVQVRYYYTLACIYRATYRVSNPRTDEIIPGATLPPWSNSSNWITNANYCVWNGIECDKNGNVDKIVLPKNNLYGTFPNEVVLIKNSLAYLDLFSNAFLYTSNPLFLQDMRELKYLYFGSTSWSFDGIPTYLNGCKKLIEIDMSKSLWTEGPIRGAAFKDLVNLEYLDMGDNVYDTAQGGMPSEITSLPALQNLYLDNCVFTPTRLQLSFMTTLPAIFELWMDFTNFDATIPTQIGNLATLSSFSCSYCNLKGSIPSQIGRTKIDRMWLFGNKLSGTIPTTLGNLSKLMYLYLEGNTLTGTVPSEVCNLRNTDNIRLQELGVDCNVQCSCCTCCGEVCGNLLPAIPPPTPSPTRAPTRAPTSGLAFCFSGDTIVHVQQQGPTRLSHVQLGDAVQVAHNKYEPVYSFGHAKQDQRATFLLLQADGNRRLEVSPDHMVFVNGVFRPASLIQVGDKLLTGDETEISVTSISSVTRTGVYAPFTPSGAIVVNDIVASNYVAFQGEEFVTIAGFRTPLSYHWMAHAFNSVHRMLYQWTNVKDESYTAEGTSYWVHTPRLMGLWLLDQHPIIMSVGVMMYVLTFGLAAIIESILHLLHSNAPYVVIVGSIVVGSGCIAIATIHRQNVVIMRCSHKNGIVKQ